LLRNYNTVSKQNWLLKASSALEQRARKLKSALHTASKAGRTKPAWVPFCPTGKETVFKAAKYNKRNWNVSCKDEKVRKTSVRKPGAKKGGRKATSDSLTALRAQIRSQSWYKRGMKINGKAVSTMTKADLHEALGK